MNLTQVFLDDKVVSYSEMQESIKTYITSIAMPRLNNLVSNGAPCAQLSSAAFYLGEFYIQIGQTINTAEMAEAMEFVMRRIEGCLNEPSINNQARQLLSSIYQKLENFYKEM